MVNAILDRRMHAEGMTDEQAMELLVRPRVSNRGRGRRQGRPLQAVFGAAVDLLRRPPGLRSAPAESQRAQGDKFDLARFHEAVLSHGTLPVKYLPELVIDP